MGYVHGGAFLPEFRRLVAGFCCFRPSFFLCVGRFFCYRKWCGGVGFVDGFQICLCCDGPDVLVWEWCWMVKAEC
ncbi:hypothetical protein P8452_48856 [Trifolium repens]|nr:hypothetical protein P8452_48856 [Trifolium repens]